MGLLYLLFDSVLVGAALLVLTRWTHAWPLAPRPSLTPPIEDAPEALVASPGACGWRGGVRAYVLCALLALGAAGQAARVEVHNARAGGLLPMPYLERGWNWESDQPAMYLRRLAWAQPERAPGPPTAAEIAAAQAQAAAAAQRNALHRVVRQSLVLYFLVPLAALWLLALPWTEGAHPRAHLASGVLLLPLAYAGYVIVARSCYTAMCGD